MSYQVEVLMLMSISRADNMTVDGNKCCRPMNKYLIVDVTHEGLNSRGLSDIGHIPTLVRFRKQQKF